MYTLLQETQGSVILPHRRPTVATIHLSSVARRWEESEGDAIHLFAYIQDPAAQAGGFVVSFCKKTSTPVPD